MPDLDFQSKCPKQIVFVWLVLLLLGQCIFSHETVTPEFEDVGSGELSDENILEALNQEVTGFTETSSRPDDDIKENLDKLETYFKPKMQGEWDNHNNYSHCKCGPCENLEKPEESAVSSHVGALRRVRGTDALLEYQPLITPATAVPVQLRYAPRPQQGGLDNSFLNVSESHAGEGLVFPVMTRRMSRRYPGAYGRIRHARRRNILANIRNAFRPSVPFQNGSDYMSLKVPLQQLVNPDDAFIIDRNGMVHKGHMHYRQFVHPVVKMIARKNEGCTTGGPQLSKPVKRDEPSMTGQPAQSSSEAPDKSPDNAKSNETSEVKDGRGSHQYQVMPTISKDETDQNASNGTSREIAAKKTILKEIIDQLEHFKVYSTSGSAITADNTPCSIFGSWISDAGGIRFDIISSSNESNSLNVSIAPTIPSKKEAWFNESEWNVTGEIPFTEKGIFTLTAVHKTQRKTALFAGQCMICMGEELVTGTWTTGRSARDCRDTIVAYSVLPDVFRREVLHILRAQKKIELASKVNKTSTEMPATEKPKKVKRWWGFNVGGDQTDRK